MIRDDQVGFARDPADDTAYFRHRADWHRRRAEIAEDSSTRALHQKFATLYQARADD